MKFYVVVDYGTHKSAIDSFDNEFEAYRFKQEVKSEYWVDSECKFFVTKCLDFSKPRN